jgi:hypothetical protein
MEASPLNQIVAATVDGQDISLHEILHSMKINGGLAGLTDAVNGILVARAAAREGITVTTEELQSAADRFRQTRGLHKASETEAWLKQNSMTVEELEAGLEHTITTDKLKDKVTANGTSFADWLAEENRRARVDIRLWKLI